MYMLIIWSFPTIYAIHKAITPWEQTETSSELPMARATNLDDLETAEGTVNENWREQPNPKS